MESTIKCATCGGVMLPSAKRVDCKCGCNKKHCYSCGMKRKRLEIVGSKSYLEVVNG